MSRTLTAEARRQDTRDKIALGGLIVKAGLRYETRALLLGALIELKQSLQSEKDLRTRLTAIGAKAFDNDK